MAYLNNTRTLSFADRFAALRNEIANTLAKRKLFQTTMHELNVLSDRELADLGIHRSMIKRVALEASNGN